MNVILRRSESFIRTTLGRIKRRGHSPVAWGPHRKRPWLSLEELLKLKNKYEVE